MNPLIHILNGDALYEQLPPSVSGERIVFRECLVEGPLAAKDDASFFAERAKYLGLCYGSSPADYTTKSKAELEKIDRLSAKAEVHLWFEDDLFCQCNCWYALWRLRDKGCRLYLVRPPAHSPYSFGHLRPDDLPGLLQHKQEITTLSLLSRLWPAYVASDHTTLLSIAAQLQEEHPYLMAAVQAEIDRHPKGDDPGRPARTLLHLIKELKTHEFAPVFRAFCEREGIYGFGDLQVKRLFDHLLEDKR